MLSLLALATIMNFTNYIRFPSVEAKIRIYLEEQKGRVEDGGRAGDVKDKLLEAREGRH